ncbi:hypothetical protein KAU86_05050 [bacterium]|nr:hypothetical protein [bacterium]
MEEREVSSYTIILFPPGMDRMFLHNPGANDTFGFKDRLEIKTPGWRFDDQAEAWKGQTIERVDR